MNPAYELSATKKIARFIDLYDRGVLLEMEAEGQIIEVLTPTNAREVFACLPDCFKERLKSRAASAPFTDQEWEAAEFIHIASYCGPELPVKSPEEEHSEDKQWKRNYRLKIEALRELLASLS
ncbi:hypothetical protein NA78x_000325 [Anatilimnocola sp. NA78]|uniref:hypothetical protein n=1 Tax=Anatilimnocola sp. NA78 TaxID=3415683 RepID=UPI003CE4B5BA